MHVRRRRPDDQPIPNHIARRSRALACAVAFAVTAVARDEPAPTQDPSASASPAASPRPARPRAPPRQRRSRRSGPSASRSTGRPTRTTPASTSPKQGLVRRRRGRRRDPPVRHDHARSADGGRPGGVRDQLPGRADLRRGGRRTDRLGDGDPPAQAQEIAVLASSPITRPRQLDGKTYAGFGYPDEEPTLKSVIKADGGKGDFTTVTLDTAAYEALYAKQADFVDHLRGLGGHRGRRSGASTCGVQVRRLRLPGLLPGRPRLRQPLAGDAPRPRPRFVGATVRGFQLAADDPAAPRPPGLANPGVFDGSPELPAASQRFLADGRLPP